MARRLCVGAFVALAIAIPAGDALAKAIVGTSGADELRGTSANDTIRARAGDDELSGGRGDDVLVGGPGADRLAGGRGDDRCLTDAADSAPLGCEDVVGPAGPLIVTDVTGADRCIVLRRAESCYFVVEGSGADVAAGSVSGTGGVDVMPPAGGVSAGDGHWSANGTYACDADGALRVTIATESVDVPVSCAPGFGES